MPQTVVHGDFRLDNLLFGSDAAGGTLPVTAIDWQVSVRGRGAADVAYFAGFCLPPDDRRAWERELVGAYHGTLLASGVAGYSTEQCWEDYRLGTFTVLSRLVTAGALLDFSSARGAALVNAIGTRCAAMLDDHHVAALLDA